MSAYDISGLSMHKLQIFVAAAESKSFKAAASCCNVTQSMVSKTIAAMEAELEVQLFTRRQDGVSLTPAGQYLYDAWSPLLSQIDSALILARQIQEGRDILLKIGCLKTIPTQKYMDPVIEHFSARHPNVTVQFDQTSLKDLTMKLVKDELDIIFTESIEVKGLCMSGCAFQSIVRGYLTACIHASDPLYDREDISILELRDRPLIYLDNKTSHNFNQYFTDVCQSYGFRPKVKVFATNAHTAAQYVRVGQGIAVVPTFSYTGANYKNIRKILLKEHIPIDLVMAWKKSNCNLFIKTFIREYLAYMRSSNQG